MVSRMLLASENGVKENNLVPIAKIVSSAVVGVEPRIMGIGPVEASFKALKKAKLKMSNIDIIELNEAFAVQSLACIRNGVSMMMTQGLILMVDQLHSATL